MGKYHTKKLSISKAHDNHPQFEVTTPRMMTTTLSRAQNETESLHNVPIVRTMDGLSEGKSSIPLSAPYFTLLLARQT